MQIIADLEGRTRGPYGGCVGYFSFNGNLDTCITIHGNLIPPLNPHPACRHPLPLPRAIENGAAHGRQSLTCKPAAAG
jgi:hypothetical protein